VRPVKVKHAPRLTALSLPLSLSLSLFSLPRQKPWAPEHRRQAQQLCDWIHKISNDLPVVLCGDFNGPPSLLGTAYRSVMGDSRFGVWHDLFLEQEMPVPLDASTVPASFYYREKFASSGETRAFASNFSPSSYMPLWLSWMCSARIDFILSLQQRATTSECAAPQVFVGAQKCIVVNSTEDDTVASDHCGVVAELKLDGQTQNEQVSAALPLVRERRSTVEGMTVRSRQCTLERGGGTDRLAIPSRRVLDSLARTGAGGEDDDRDHEITKSTSNNF
jgi:hypothetical protein